jgi:hypothetical protein
LLALLAAHHILHVSRIRVNIFLRYWNILSLKHIPWPFNHKARPRLILSYTHVYISLRRYHITFSQFNTKWSIHLYIILCFSQQFFEYTPWPQISVHWHTPVEHFSPHVSCLLRTLSNRTSGTVFLTSQK